MGKIRDFFYNQSDVFLAILILAIAGFVIYSKVGLIMGFTGDDKNALSKGSSGTAISQQSSSAENDNGNSQNTTSDKKPADKGKYLDKSGNPIKCSIFVPYGANADHIAGLTVSAEIMDSKQEFFDAYAKYGGGRSLLSGTFIIPLAATDEEIIQYLTGIKQ